MMELTEKIIPHTVMFGCDPEFFFEKNGQIIGSEKIIDIKKGFGTGQKGKSKYIVDGVQAELNPEPNACRASLANEISKCFRDLHAKISADKSLSINFKPTVKITKEELMSLDEKSRTFGCAPSKNINKKSKNSVHLRDPKTYMYRSAGGHIHIGAVENGAYHPGGNTTKFVLREPARLIAIMDIIVGNTCVLIDRDPSNKERRKVYGKAGEYRTPPHGVEYRTLSNFWLRSYPLMSFVMNLSRMSVSILANTMPGRDFERELLKSVNMSKIHQAINDNDAELAWNNFQRIKPFIARYIPTDNYDFPLTQDNLEIFEFFVEKGIDHWFTEDPMSHWMSLPNANGQQCGWESFLRNRVKPQMMEERPSPVPKALLKKK